MTCALALQNNYYVPQGSAWEWGVTKTWWVGLCTLVGGHKTKTEKQIETGD